MSERTHPGTYGLVILAASVAGISAALAINFPGARAPIGNSSAPQAQTAPAYAFAEDHPPARLIIPAINVDAAIQAVGVSSTGAMDVAHSYSDVGWYKYGPVPGAPGNAVIEGHLDTAISPYAVFYHLNELVPGDGVTVMDAEGRTLEFTVTGSKSYPYTATSTDEVFGPAHESRLNLVTCDGIWIPAKHSYTERLVVFTKRVK